MKSTQKLLLASIKIQNKTEEQLEKLKDAMKQNPEQLLKNKEER